MWRSRFQWHTYFPVCSLEVYLRQQIILSRLYRMSFSESENYSISRLDILFKTGSKLIDETPGIFLRS